MEDFLKGKKVEDLTRSDWENMPWSEETFCVAKDYGEPTAWDKHRVMVIEELATGHFYRGRWREWCEKDQPRVKRVYPYQKMTTDYLEKPGAEFESKNTQIDVVGVESFSTYFDDDAGSLILRLKKKDGTTTELNMLGMASEVKKRLYLRLDRESAGEKVDKMEEGFKLLTEVVEDMQRIIKRF